METIKFTTEKRDGLTFSFQNKEEFETIYTDIFINKDYYFETDRKNPLIIDGGSHIGVSVLYFATLYPNARIIAFEPNPYSFQLLKKNIADNKIKNVELHHAVLTERHGQVEFYISAEEQNPWTMNNSMSEDRLHPGDAVLKQWIDAVTLSEFIKERVDLVKLDIQGQEQNVIYELAGLLSFVDRIKLEYHGKTIDPENDLQNIHSMLWRHGFHIHMTQQGKEVDVDKAIDEDLHWIIVHGDK